MIPMSCVQPSLRRSSQVVLVSMPRDIVEQRLEHVECQLAAGQRESSLSGERLYARVVDSAESIEDEDELYSILDDIDFCRAMRSAYSHSGQNAKTLLVPMLPDMIEERLIEAERGIREKTHSTQSGEALYQEALSA